MLLEIVINLLHASLICRHFSRSVPIVVDVLKTKKLSYEIFIIFIFLIGKTTKNKNHNILQAHRFNMISFKYDIKKKTKRQKYYIDC